VERTDTDPLLAICNASEGLAFAKLELEQAVRDASARGYSRRTVGDAAGLSPSAVHRIVKARQVRDAAQVTSAELGARGIDARQWSRVLKRLEEIRASLSEVVSRDLTPEATTDALNDAKAAARFAAIDLEQMATSARRWRG